MEKFRLGLFNWAAEYMPGWKITIILFKQVDLDLPDLTMSSTDNCTE